MAEVAHTEVPKFDGCAGSFANYDAEVNLWKRISAMEHERMAAHLLLHMSDVARRVCMPVDQISKILREHSAPDAVRLYVPRHGEVYVLQTYGAGYGRVPDGIRHVAPKS